MRADTYTVSFICRDQWGNRFSFGPVALAVESLCAFSGQVLLSSMIVKDVIPLYWFSTSSNIGDKDNSSIYFQQTESCAVKTLHNGLQRKTTVMDRTPPWKGGKPSERAALMYNPQWPSASPLPFFLFLFSFVPIRRPLLSPFLHSSTVLSSPILFPPLPFSILSFYLSFFFVLFFLLSPPPFPLYPSPFLHHLS